MPCTSSEFIEIHAVAGKPRYPKKAGFIPKELISLNAISSKYPVETPGCKCEDNIFRTFAAAWPAFLILTSSLPLFISIDG
jgi:hypothetical protein